ncbi:hypothetical protein AGMMS49992_15250 [Clostridia bacterium]|nr:hypothetical protein AGMMS49992_15250 [Clostridia bacterium]
MAKPILRRDGRWQMQITFIDPVTGAKSRPAFFGRSEKEVWERYDAFIKSRGKSIKSDVHNVAVIIRQDMIKITYLKLRIRCAAKATVFGNDPGD